MFLSSLINYSMSLYPVTSLNAWNSNETKAGIAVINIPTGTAVSI
jgi:hypothetical protein